MLSLVGKNTKSTSVSFIPVFFSHTGEDRGGVGSEADGGRRGVVLRFKEMRREVCGETMTMTVNAVRTLLFHFYFGCITISAEKLLAGNCEAVEENPKMVVGSGLGIDHPGGCSPITSEEDRSDASKLRVPSFWQRRCRQFMYAPPPVARPPFFVLS